jgi:hypothetical protein
MLPGTWKDLVRTNYALEPVLCPFGLPIAMRILIRYNRKGLGER